MEEQVLAGNPKCADCAGEGGFAVRNFDTLCRLASDITVGSACLSKGVQAWQTLA